MPNNQEAPKNSAKVPSWTETQVNYAIRIVALLLAALLAVFVFVKIINEVKAYNSIGKTPESPYMISVSGKGEVTAKKDIAVLSFTSNGKGATAADAQSKAAALNNEALDFLKSKGIPEKDISTQSYNTYPTYSNKVKPCIVERSSGAATMEMVSAPSVPCDSYEQVVTGYETTQVVEVKLRNTDTNVTLSSEVITGLGNAGVQVGNLVNTIDKPEVLQSQARDLAIRDAYAQAQEIARSLGVKIGKVVSYGDIGAYPMYAEADMMMSAKASAAPSMAPGIPTGEGKVTSNVTITFELKQ